MRGLNRKQPSHGSTHRSSWGSHASSYRRSCGWLNQIRPSLRSTCNGLWWRGIRFNSVMTRLTEAPAGIESSHIWDRLSQAETDSGKLRQIETYWQGRTGTDEDRLTDAETTGELGIENSENWPLGTVMQAIRKLPKIQKLKHYKTHDTCIKFTRHHKAMKPKVSKTHDTFGNFLNAWNPLKALWSQK